ncbi:MAG: response regulator [Bryobacterales bacterium]|nr:response regulator [Bryobacterales bacterium]
MTQSLSRVLVVDDEEPARYGISRALSSEGYELAEAASGEHALQELERFGPDVILSDINMPGLDGLSLLRRVRGGPGDPPAVILITGYGSENVIIEALRSGAFDYLTKPFEISELRTAVRHAAEEQRLRRELRQSQTALLQSERLAALTRLVAGIAHEVNTPLGALQSSMDLIARMASRLRTVVPDEHSHLGVRIEESAQQSIEACQRITGIVSDLIAFAQIDRADIQRTSIAPLIENTLRLLRSTWSDRIEVEVDLNELPAIECYPRELNQLILNLLMNAGQAIEQTGRPGAIRVRAWTEDGWICLEVADTGPGIPPEHLTRIFDPGFTTKGVGVGLGLGLPICDRIARAHGGSLTVRSTPGEGAAFLVRLPVLHGS